MSQTAARQAPQPEPPRLFLVSRRAGAYASFLERVADIYHLYPYGRAGLSGIVRSESERAAFVLSIVFCFDLLAWTLIWNAVFQRGQVSLGWPTVFAALIGSLFALVIFNFEQGFITSDWTVRGTGKRLKLAAAAVLRIAAIGASAYATSQPLELLVFANDIQDRVHQERVWEEIAVQAIEFQRLEDEQAGKGGVMEQTLLREDRSENALTEASEQQAVNAAKLSADHSSMSSLQNSLPRLYADAETKRQQYKAATQSGDPTGVEAARSEMSRADRAVNGVTARIKFLTGQLGNREIEAARLGAVVRQVKDKVIVSKEEVKEERKDLGKQLETLRGWVRTLSLSRPDQHDIQSPPGFPPFVERPYSFAEQRRVLDDLRFGRPIQRRNLALTKSDVLSNELKLQDPAIADNATSDDRISLAAVVTQLYWALFVVALFIPGMGLLFKLIIHARLGDYYSEEYQASSGHPEAMQAIQTDEFLKRRRNKADRDDDKYRRGRIL